MSSIIKVDVIQKQNGDNLISEADGTVTIGAAGQSFDFPAGTIITDFQSTGIDDNATSTAITIDSSQNVSATGEVSAVVKRIYLKTTNNQAITDGATVYKTWETQTHIDTDTFTHTASSDNITIDRAGLYHIIVNLSFENATDSARNTVRTSIRINGSEVVSARSYDYDRGALYGRHSNNKINTIQNLSASDVIDVIMFGENIDGSLTVEAPECELHIYRMGTSS